MQWTCHNLTQCGGVRTALVSCKRQLERTLECPQPSACWPQEWCCWDGVQDWIHSCIQWQDKHSDPCKYLQRKSKRKWRNTVNKSDIILNQCSIRGGIFWVLEFMFYETTKSTHCSPCVITGAWANFFPQRKHCIHHLPRQSIVLPQKILLAQNNQ